MAELPADLKAEVERFCAEGDELLDHDRYDDALVRFSAAWNLLPEPREDCADASWIQSGIGDAHFFRGDFGAARQAFMAVLRCGGEPDNPYLRLRLGQCLFELGEHREAANWLTGAYLLEGKEIFAAADPKYLEFIKAQLQPPPGGWPDGW
jgi:tetratricopeptide (TPR) repeat protein